MKSKRLHRDERYRSKCFPGAAKEVFTPAGGGFAPLPYVYSMTAALAAIFSETRALRSNASLSCRKLRPMNSKTPMIFSKQ
jgi:hypothetical protein